MGTFTVNGRLAALAEMAGTFAERVLLGDDPKACIRAHLIGQDADGKISVYQLVVPGELIDTCREAAFEKWLPEHERMMFICEAWVARIRDSDYVPGSNLGDHPGRQEAVVFDGRDNKGNRVSGLREIVRSERPYLLPIVWIPPERSRYLPSRTDNGVRV